MHDDKKPSSVLYTFAQSASGIWGAVKAILLVLLIVFFVSSHVFTGLAVITSNVLGSLFQTTTALSQARTSSRAATEKLEANERQLKKAQADLDTSQNKVKTLEAKSASQTGKLEKLRKENRALKNGNMIVFRGKQVRLDDAVRTTVVGLQSRTKKVATANVASAAGESIPI